MTPQPKLGILAGGGSLPTRLVQACQASGRPCFVLALEGQAEPGSIAGVEHAWLPFGAAAKALAILREAAVQELVFAGPVRRPSLGDIRPDWRAAKFLASLSMKGLGDDGLLRAIAEEFQKEGFQVVSVDQVLGGLLASLGPLGRLEADSAAMADIKRGMAVARALGEADVGQAVVVQQGVVLGVEAVEGTDALLARAAGLRLAGQGGVLVKIAKPQQDRRVDQPTIGVATVEAAAAAGLRGIAVEAGGTLVVDREAVARAADDAGLFVVGVTVEP